MPSDMNKISHQYKEVKMNLCMARCRKGIVPVKKLYARKTYIASFTNARRT